ncbi:ATP-binding protein [Hyalangium versicolor]|uniref:ATP-binding protein n=1 Tax=Hyalangium versicolor TaxID=2861190 RepID=UPI001CCA7A06|nr:ATP-binding protein [Hyalangium versicolor]
MKRLLWLIGPPAAGKSTWAAKRLEQPDPPRVLELSHLLQPLMDPSRQRKGMMQARSLLMNAIRRVELDPANDDLPPLLVISAILREEDLFPLHTGEEVLLLLPSLEQWERQFIQRPKGHAPGSRSMSMEEARGWYDRYSDWKNRGLPMTWLPGG